MDVRELEVIIKYCFPVMTCTTCHIFFVTGDLVNELRDDTEQQVQLKWFRGPVYHRACMVSEY